jgi:AraC-like DNA-binding protein
LSSAPHETRADILRAAFASYHLPLDARLRPTEGIDARFSALTVGRTQIESFSVRGASGTAVRRATTADSGVEPLLTLHVLTGGAVAVRHADRLATLTPGSMLFSSTQHPLLMSQQQRSGMSTITLPLDRLRIPRSALDAGQARAFRSVDPVAQTCVHLIGRLLGDSQNNPEADWAVMEATMTELVRALFLLVAGDERASRDALGASLSDRIVAHLELNALDPDLDAAGIAAAHGISVRYLYVVLRQRGILLGDWVREKRLEHAAHLLRDPASAHITISEIAQRSGFSDHPHFSRTFKKRYDASPREWRATRRLD